MNATTMKLRKARKGFSLVELVVVILIIAVLAVAVFAGGSTVIKKSQVSRTTSDLHNFSVAVEAFMNETPSVANSTKTGNFDKFIAALNANLSADYQMKNTTAIVTGTETDAITKSGGNITIKDTLLDPVDGEGNPDTNVAVYESEKTDAWGNHYYVILDSGERHGDSNSDFYITVVSAGPDAKTELAGRIGGATTDAAKIDDIFLLVQYENGNVSAVTYNTATDEMQNCSNVTTGALSALAKGTALYNAADSATPVNCPVNF